MEPTPKSPSASPEEGAAALIGIDPDDVSVVEYGPAKFTLGVLPAGKWDVLDARFSAARQDAFRRATKDLSDAGLDPEDANLSYQKALTYPEFQEAIRSCCLEALAYSLRAVENFTNRKRQPFPFEVVDGKLSDATLRVYAQNGQLLRALWLHVRAMNDMSLAGKKV